MFYHETTALLARSLSLAYLKDQSNSDSRAEICSSISVLQPRAWLMCGILLFPLAMADNTRALPWTMKTGGSYSVSVSYPIIEPT